MRTPAPRPRAISGSVTRAQHRGRAHAERPGDVVELGRHLGQRRPHATIARGMNSIAYATSSRARGLVERRDGPDGHGDQGERDDDARQRAADVVGALDEAPRTGPGSAPRPRRSGERARVVTAAPAASDAERGGGRRVRARRPGRSSRTARGSHRPMRPAGTPSASATSAARPSRASGVARPAAASGRGRAVAGADPRQTRAPGRGRSSPASSTRQSSTSTPASMVAAGPSNVDWNCVVDRRGERGEPQHLQSAELGEQVQSDQQRAAEDGRPQLGQHGPTDRGRPGRGPARAPTPRCTGSRPRSVAADRQVDEREVRQRRDQHRPGEAVDGGGHRHPGVAVDEGRHGERGDERARPHRPARDVGALDQPGRRGRRPPTHAEVVASTRPTVLTSSSPTRARKSRATAVAGPARDGRDDDVAERHERQDRHRDRRREPSGSPARRGAVTGRGHARPVTADRPAASSRRSAGRRGS